ncbi:DUF4174 domain-containing protein [Gymnodinialimonas sp. 2305UL16-5]|uniref:DUF4174 domain-containing protein n=1 Tax=Gymnodinialimonas mytili TaxID=3126503 RepID=UPI0030A8FA60
MRRFFLTLVVALLAAQTATAQGADEATISFAGDSEASADTPDDPLAPRSAEGLTLDDFLWTARPIVIFADTPADPRFIEQIELLERRPDPLLDRDVVIITDTDPSARSDIRTALRPRGFSVVVISKDGTVGLRRPAPRDVREIVRAIDNFQLRQEEIRRGQ